MNTQNNKKRSPLVRLLCRAFIGALAFLIVVFVGSLLFLRASLPQLTGTVGGIGLKSPVTITRDSGGVPTIIAQNRLDAAYATGFLHGQERFFQMDLLRRSAAGELSALLGQSTLLLDRERRFHRFRSRADKILHSVLTKSDLDLLSRYTAGVNAGLNALGTRPFEYALLRTKPAAWTPSDTLLVIWAMYFDLQMGQEAREFARGWLKEHSTREQLAFFLPEASSYDAPLDAAEMSQPPLKIPEKAPEWFGSLQIEDASHKLKPIVGSNGWALAGSRTSTGAAIVANDMHMGLSLPNVWYRTRLKYPDSAGKTIDVIGVTLPGNPLTVIGSNRHVAWGFTNSLGDYTDLIELERDPADPPRFKTLAGWETVSKTEEKIFIKGGDKESLEVLECSLGPIKKINEKYYAIHWIAHESGAVNLNFLGMEGAGNVEAALSIGNSAGIPALNMVAADSAGHIGWTIAGTLPRRASQFATTFPSKFDTVTTWTTLRAASEYPRILDPSKGQLWTANSRAFADERNQIIGDGGLDIGARSQQIRDDLSKLEKADEKSAYQIMLDDRALFMSAWRRRALHALDDAAIANNPKRREFKRLLENQWTDRAGADAVGYRLTRAYFDCIYAEMFSNVDRQLYGINRIATFALANQRWPVVAGILLDIKPAGWLPSKKWRDMELAAIDRTIQMMTYDGKPLSRATWGSRNQARIAHPFAASLPPLRRWLSAPPDPMPGDDHMPRVFNPIMGPTERLVVSPGHEEQGIFNMPGGQSGHPLSPYFLAGHAAWVRGEPAPLLPGPIKHKLMLKPE